MGKRTVAEAPTIDDHSGLNIDGTITFLSDQVAGQKNIFTRDKPINVDTIEPQTQPTPIKMTRSTPVTFSGQLRIVRCSNNICTA